MSIEDLLAELSEDAPRLATEALDAIVTAETVETERDFRANVADALEAARALVTELERLKALT